VADLVQMISGVHQQPISTQEAIYHFQLTLATLKNKSITNCAKTHHKFSHYGFFGSRANHVSGRAEFIDNCTIKITDFTYDDGGPEVYLYGAVDHQYSESNAFAMGQEISGIDYNNNEIILRITDNKILDNITGMSMCCLDFNANFDQVTFTP
jgi:hypothetical protein